MLGCDGCGNTVVDTGDDDARRWLALSVGPSLEGGLGMLPTITFAESWTDDEPAEPEPVDLEPVTPTRHFCGLACLGAWVDRAQEAAPHPPAP